MKLLRKFLPGLLLAVWLSAPVPAQAVEQAPEEPALISVTTDPQLAAELRRIHREIAALRAELAQPGIKEVFSGLGYILGLFGVAAFVAARRKER
jgi:nickel transport protein